jgi:hypothetical protein
VRRQTGRPMLYAAIDQPRELDPVEEIMLYLS